LGILSIEEITEFNIDKEFLDKNNFKSEKDFKDGLKDNLQNQYQNFLLEIEKKQLMDVLESKNIFDVPEGILEEEFEAIWHKVQHAKKDKKLDEDDKLLTEDKLKKRYEKIALRRVKLAVLLQYIANEQKISISEQELTDGMLKYASQYPGQEKQIFDYFKQNPSSIESIRGPIFEKKIVDFILSRIKQEKTNITINEFEKLQEKTFNYKKEK
jgi:FKBP-type peptidyl-prolyl cis-trans isomerase (trigger factor)